MLEVGSWETKDGQVIRVSKLTESLSSQSLGSVSLGS